MPIYRVTVMKTSPQMAKFTNVYYLNTAGVSEMESKVGDLVPAEATLFGSTVTIYNVHWDQLGSDNFGNMVFNTPGTLSATTPVKPFIVAKVIFPVANYYPHYKLYRLHSNSSTMVGREWSSGVQTLLTDFCTDIYGNLGGALVTKEGDTLGVPTYSDEYFNLNESKKWHNRS